MSDNDRPNALFVGSTEGTTNNIYQVQSNASWSTPQFSANIMMNSDPINGIHPRLYFKYLKSKLNVIENRKLKQRLKQLEKMADDYVKSGQEALSDECIKQFLIITRESAILACGLNLFLIQEHIEKFRYKIKGIPLKITELKNFARPLPKNIVKKVKKCIEKKLFDTYWVLHLDNKAIKDTEKERIKKKEAREKDPILVGRIEYSDKHYFIGDWEDEFDDLRLNDIIKKLSLKRKNITLKQKIEKIKSKKEV